MKNILFLCTGNSARSIIAEAYTNHAGRTNWRAYSAGSKPIGKTNPFAIETLETYGIPATLNGQPPRSKSWDEFARDDSPIMDVVVTVCDNAAGELCPVWPSRNSIPPRKLHWSFPDPAATEGSDDDKRAAFSATFQDIRKQIDSFLSE